MTIPSIQLFGNIFEAVEIRKGPYIKLIYQPKQCLVFESWLLHKIQVASSSYFLYMAFCVMLHVSVHMRV